MRELEARFPEELVVVGVHSGKFIAERVTANIRAAAARLALAHPVVNDRQYRIWRSYAVNAWPTLVLVDPGGYVVGEHAGEVTAEQLAPAVARVAEAARAAGTLDRTPPHFPPEPAPAGALAFPQKLALDAGGTRLALADTGHDRILLLRLAAGGRAAELEAVVGAGKAGLADGSFHVARFHRPHGLAFAGDRLFVADTENHAVRQVDLAAGQVTTLAGNGTQAAWRAGGGVGGDVALNSPWDLLAHGGVLTVAMAGTHQLWRLDPANGRAEPWVGSGAEALHDGPAADAALAQPSGLAAAGVGVGAGAAAGAGARRLFFADSESSAIRAAGPDGRVDTIVGTGLFDFGDRDGVGDAVRLQHPLGLAWHEGALLVADTYNDAIKRVDPGTRAATTWLAGEVAAGGLWEPGGLAVGAGRVFIADSNHHRIVSADPAAGDVVELAIRGL